MISIYPVIASIQYAKNLEKALASGQLHPGVRGRLLSIIQEMKNLHLTILI